MRLTVLVLICFPVAGFAQSVTLPTENAANQPSQSCPSGMVWSGISASCIVPAQTASPAQSYGGGHDCSASKVTEAVSS